VHEACHAATHILIGAPLIRVAIMPREVVSGHAGGVTEPDNAAVLPEQALMTTLAGIFGTLVTEPEDHWATSIRNDRAYRKGVGR
jgi:hypothetical protein